jgi:hypothetical protein
MSHQAHIQHAKYPCRKLKKTRIANMRDSLFDSLWSDNVENFYHQTDYCEDAMSCTPLTAEQDTEIFKLFNLEEPSHMVPYPLDMDVPFFADVFLVDHFTEPNSKETSPQVPCLHDYDIVLEQEVETEDTTPKPIQAVHFFKPFQQEEEEEPMPEPQKSLRARRVISSDSEAEDSEEFSPTTRRRAQQTPKITSRPSKVILRSPDPKVSKKKRATKQSRKLVPAYDDHDTDTQCSCCISGCSNVVTNRLRFSLRRPSTFKDDFVDKGWNKVCGYHYFSDLYQHKKATGA